MSSETTDTPELVTCPDCGRVWDGFAQCFPCEPPTPETSVEVSEVTEVSTATPTPAGEEEVVVEVLSPRSIAPPSLRSVCSSDFQDLRIRRIFRGDRESRR